MGLLNNATITMQHELRRYSAMLRQMTEYEVVHTYWGDTSPYRWEIRWQIRPNEFIWLGTILLDGPEISALYALSPDEQRMFLRAKLSGAIGHC